MGSFSKIKFIIFLLLIFFITFSASVLFIKEFPQKEAKQSQQVIAKSDVVYKGPIYNVFFHPLIAYPRLAFDPKNTRLEYMDSWFITTREFNKVIQELYERGFVLVSPKDVFEEKKDSNGHIIIARKKILLPSGKKPLILSLDDYNFYNSMKLHGTIHRFWIDPQNRLATVTNHTRGTAIVRYDQEVPQLMENFIAAHPDFSFNKARGIFSLTGYNGIFGYDTHKPLDPNYSLQLNETKKIIGKLKAMGWEFGSHSYFHLSSTKQSERAFETAEKRWIKEVGALVGPSSYYFFPFGEAWDRKPKRMKFLQSLGYKYFFGVATFLNSSSSPGLIVMDRFPIDGLAVRNRYGSGNVFVTPSRIFDADRPASISRRKSH